MHSHAVTAAHKWRVPPCRCSGCLASVLLRGLRLRTARARQRRQLAELPGFRLADIGIGEAERRRECAKRFWQE